MFRTSESTSPSSSSSFPLMCRTRKSTSVSNPKPNPTSPSTSTTPRHGTPSFSATATSTSSSSTPSFTHPRPRVPTITTSSSSSSLTSIASLRLNLSDNKVLLYPFSEISAATNNFLNKKLSSSSSCWRCNLRGKDTVVFQQNFSGDPADIPAKLSSICRGYHSSIARLLGVSVPSSSDHIYLIYDYISGASLQECLRNSRNPNYTPLSKWISRIKIAADLAQGLEYIHVHCNTVHNRIKSSGIIITDPDLNAKICHFGAADLAGEIPIPKQQQDAKLKRSNSRRNRVGMTRGYIAPEVIAGGAISRRSDVFALGVAILELVSGMEPLKFTVDKEDRDCLSRVSVIETAREAMGTEDEDGADELEAEERKGRVRRWVDRRLRDSFPVEAAEKLIRVALRCVEEEAWMRPEMTWVAGKVSKLYLDSRVWESQVAVPTDFSVSFAPR